jgi:hypothetical protein
MPVIGYLSGRSADAEGPIRLPFLRASEEFGFAAGRNVAMEYRFSQGHDERLPELAAELVRRPVTMLVATDRPSVHAGYQNGPHHGRVRVTATAGRREPRPSVRAQGRRLANPHRDILDEGKIISDRRSTPRRANALA